MRRNHILSAVAAACIVLMGMQAHAGTTGNNFTVSMTVVPTCTYTGPSSLAFGSYTSFGTAPAPQSAAGTIKCTSGLPYTLKWDDASSNSTPVYNVANALISSNLTFTDVPTTLQYTLSTTTPPSMTGKGATPEAFTIVATLLNPLSAKCTSTVCSFSHTRSIYLTY